LSKRSDDLLSAMQQMRFRHLRALMKLQESRSIAAAAQLMGISQPALTKMLREIEGMVGQQLFTRSSRGISATKAGELLCWHARRLHAVLRETAEDMHAVDDGSGGHVVVGSMLTASSILIPATIARLKADMPGVTITILEGINERHLPGLLVGEIDMIVGRVPETSFHQQLLQEPLFEERIQLFVRKGHPLADCCSPTLAELAELAWVLPPTETALRRRIEEEFHRRSLRMPRDLVETVSLLTVRALLLQGDRIAALPHHVLDLECQVGLVRPLPLDLAATDSRVGVILRRDASLLPAAAKFLACLRTEAQRLNMSTDRGASGNNERL
jgi:DNA-binding transcriptional LysR family regulator